MLVSAFLYDTKASVCLIEINETTSSAEEVHISNVKEHTTQNEILTSTFWWKEAFYAYMYVQSLNKSLKNVCNKLAVG